MQFMKYFCLVILLFVSNIALSQQEEHAWVYFTDKPNATTALQTPLSILTQDAIDRKNLHNTAIDERDVPVDETYITTIKNQTGIVVKAKSKWMNCVHVIGTQTNVDALLNLAIVDSIHYADNTLNTSSRFFQSEKSENKFQVNVDFDYGNAENQVDMLNVDELHEADYSGEGMIIAVLDAGFPNVNTMGGLQRLRDNNNLLGGYDFVLRSSDFNNTSLNSHGTLVLSDMAGYIEDDFVGTGPDAGYYLFRTEDASSETPVEESYWVEAAERADSLGVDIINSSLGYTTFDESRYDYTMNDMDGNTAFITKGANIAVEKGILVVNSAGNSGNSNSFYKIGAPADGDAFAIGAVDADENYASFSSIGPSADGRVKPDVVAQGQLSAVITSGNNITYASGTSFSSPIMAGAIASFWQADPSKTNLEIMQLVRESASIYDNPTNQLGYGIPNFDDALEELLSTSSFSEATLQFYPNPVSDKIYFKNFIGNEKISIYNSMGQVLIHEENISASGMDISNFDRGIYIVEVSKNDELINFKILKQ
ncbi:Por secretion system C-terminal sorting domain-containing protein [Pustulibacterium marinum]|uniref:Por secretion system C-terminal sorting domain-containing protein n=2 Tax=Pustulibacterium marinum TaxID=1224947 RepID=A0A1I7HR78_9FLAO|nr:Por secretion system C-terminal sorting domain-containing protein [Pustulibacterium marinum]